MDHLFDAAGSLRADYERVDWAATPLGPMSSWSPTLRAAVDLALNTQFAVALFWGPELVLVYNTAYRAMIGEKHPRALGARAKDVFPEIWDTIGPLLDGVMSGAGTVSAQNERLLLERRGFAEETFFTFSYSAVRDADGVTLGAIDIATETTEQVRSLRRLATVTQLSERLSRLGHPDELRDLALPVLRTAGEDLIAVDICVTGCGGDDPRLPDAPPAVTVPGAVFQDTTAGTVVWLPLVAPGPTEPLQLVVLLSPHLLVDDEYRGYLNLIAHALTMALERSRVREVERREAEASRAMSETLQRSLLTTPTVPPGYELVVHYRAAAAEAQVGGDWYDSFALPDGTTTVVVGDVTGHDQDAAAAMAQVRNLLRGVAYTIEQGPAGVLRALDAAMHGLRTKSLATAVVGQLDAEGGVRWSNAGHPPPVLVAADGTARLLYTRPEILLGVQTAATRTDHEMTLEPGDTLVLYTDGLVERRGQPIDVSTDYLVSVLDGVRERDPEQLCRLLLEHFADTTDDDIVLLVLRRNCA